MLDEVRRLQSHHRSVMSTNHSEKREESPHQKPTDVHDTADRSE